MRWVRKHERRPRHKQVETPLHGLGMVEVDEDLSDILYYLNMHLACTTFSCQGDEEWPAGYISFAPDEFLLDTDRRRVESLVGLTEPAPIIEKQPDSLRNDFPLGHIYWSPPWDGRPDGGRIHGWALYFGYLRTERCAMCRGPLMPWSTFSYHERCVH